MRKLLLCFVLTFGSGLALGSIPTVDCLGCSSLRDFGNFGASQLYRASGTAGPTVGNDRIWVVNSESGQQVFVDLDTPITLTYFMGVPIPLPDYTQTEVNATWIDGSESATWVLPNEVVAAIGESVELAESDATPEVTAEELPELPGFDNAYVWQFIGNVGGQLPVDLVFNLWSFHVRYNGGGGTPVVTIYECAWTSAC